MISLDEALARVAAVAEPNDIVNVPIDRALAATLAEAVISGVDVPEFANSAMDGVGVRAADGDQPRRLVGTVFAGPSSVAPVGAGEAVRIMTGAPIPEGVDAVEMIERVHVDGQTVRLDSAPPVGQFIRKAAEDVAVGQPLFGAGDQMNASMVGALRSIGVSEVAVIRPPRVGVVSTGDELVSDDRPLRPGEIRDSNRPMLLAAIRALGFEAVDLGTVADDRPLIEHTLADGAERCDVLLSSGGVSMGEADLIKAILMDTGDVQWMQVAIKPAKPLAVGVLFDTPLVGLPGNPVSARVSFELFAREVIERVAGRGGSTARWVPATLAGDLARRADGKIHFPRVRLGVEGHHGWTASPVGAQGSHQLAATAMADAIAWLADGDGLNVGETVPVLALN